MWRSNSKYAVALGRVDRAARTMARRRRVLGIGSGYRAVRRVPD